MQLNSAQDNVTGHEPCSNPNLQDIESNDMGLHPNVQDIDSNDIFRNFQYISPRNQFKGVF
jgi:hypothetical protein